MAPVASFDPSRPFTAIDAAIAGSTPANPSAIDLAVAPAIPAAAPAPPKAPVFDPSQEFTPVPEAPAPVVGGPVFDPKAEFQKAFSIDDLKSKTVEELDKESDFHPVEFNHQFEDALNADPIAKQKLLDVYKLREATGRTTVDQLKKAAAHPLDTVGGVIAAPFKTGAGLIKSVVKAGLNASGAIGGTVLAGIQYAGGANPKTVNDTLSAAGSMGAEIGAAVETDATSTINLLRKGVRDSIETVAKADPTGFVQDVTGVKPTSELTNEEWAARLSTDVSNKRAEAETSRGTGEMVKALGIHADDLRASGIEIRPEVVQELAPAVSLLNFIPLGAGAKVGLMTKVGGRYAVRELATAATKTEASGFIAAMNAGAEKVATGAVQSLGKGVEVVGSGVSKAGDFVNRYALEHKGVGTQTSAILAGTAGLATGGKTFAAVKLTGPILFQTGRAVQAAGRGILAAAPAVADIGGEFVKGYGQGLLFTAPFMIGADAEEREGLLGAAGLGGLARGGVRAFGHGKIAARLAGEAIQEKNADIIFKEVNQSTPPVDPRTPYGTDPRLDAESSAQIAKLDLDPARARQARVDALTRKFDLETARMDAQSGLSPRQFEKRARERAERIAKVPETVTAQQNLLGWAKNLFKDTPVEFYAVDDAGMMRQTGGQSGRGFTVRTGQTIAPDGTIKPLIRVFMNGDVESLPHEMLHALGEIDAPGYAEYLNKVNETLTPDQQKSFETIYNTVHNGGLPEAQWKNRLTPDKVRNEIAAELFSRTVLGEDLSGVSPSLTKQAAIFTAGLLEKMGIPLGKLTRAQAKDFLPKGAKIKKGFSTLGLRPGVEAQALGHNFVQGLLKRAAEDALPVAPEKSLLAGGTLVPGKISRKPPKGGPPPPPGAAPITPGGIPPITPITPAAPATPKPRNIRTTPAAQGDFAAQRAAETGIDKARDFAKTASPEVAAKIEEIAKNHEAGNSALEIVHEGVIDTGTAAAPTGETARDAAQQAAYVREREIALGAMPEKLREEHQKIFKFVRFNESKGGKLYVEAMSLDKVITNAHKLATDIEAARSKGRVVEKLPYEVSDGELTGAGWGDLVKDIQDYTDNQANGYRGDGDKLVRPTEAQAPGISIPAENPAYVPKTIAPERANFLNIVMGLKDPPLTAREIKGQVPGNVKGQVLAELNPRARGIEKPSVIRAGDLQTFKTSGRDIMEMNPLRNDLRAAGVPVRDLFPVTERINVENIQKVTPRPDINFEAPVTDTIRGGFLPGEGATGFIKRQTTEQIGKQVLDASPEAWQKLTSDIGGLTGAAYKLGVRLKDAGDVAKLRAFEAEAKTKYAEAKATQDFDGMMLAATKKQFFTEAIETATGMNPGKQATIARVLGADWKPPFPEGQLLPKVNNPRAVESAAVRNAETGDIFTGSPTHGEAMRKAAIAEGIPKDQFSLSVAYSNPNYEQGFVTQGGEFLNRTEAMNRVKELGQIAPEDITDSSQLYKGEKLESVGFQSNRQFLPAKKKQTAEERIAATDYSKYDTAPSTGTPRLTGWILPNRKYVPMDVSFHEQFLADQADDLNKRFGTNFSKTPNVEDRLVALNKGFVRIRGGLQGGQRTSGAGGVVVEMNEKFFPKVRGTLESYLVDNADSIDNLTVNLLNDKGNVKDYQRAVVHELDGAEKANALLAVLDDLRLRGPEGQALPGGDKVALGAIKKLNSATGSIKPRTVRLPVRLTDDELKALRRFVSKSAVEIDKALTRPPNK